MGTVFEVNGKSLLVLGLSVMTLGLDADSVLFLGGALAADWFVDSFDDTLSFSAVLVVTDWDW